MEKIHVSFIKDLRNREFSLLIDTIAGIVAESTRENESLKKATKNLQSHYKSLLQLKDTKPRHYLTRIIKEKVDNRTEYLVGLRMRIESALFSPIPKERVAAERLMYWIDPYRKVLFKPSIGVQTQAVGFLNLDKSESTTIQEHTALLNLDYILDIVVAETEEIKRLVTERGKDKAQRAINGKKVRAAAYYDLRVLLDAMKTIYNLSSSEQEVEQMAWLSGLINENLKSFRRELRSRNTKRSNKKEVDVAVSQLIEPQEEPKEKLAFITYNDLRLDRREEISITDTPQHKTISTLLSTKDKHKSNKIVSSTKSDNKKGGDGKLPPINSN